MCDVRSTRREQSGVVVYSMPTKGMRDLLRAATIAGRMIAAGERFWLNSLDFDYHHWSCQTGCFSDFQDIPDLLTKDQIC